MATTNKKDIKVNEWTTKKERLLKYWQEECRFYGWLYSQNAHYYQGLNKNLSIVCILLSAITGATLLNNTSDINAGVVLAFGLISIVSSFLQGLRQFLDLDSRISSNTLACRQNSAIVLDIEEQLNLTREDRINGLEFVKNIKSRKNEIIQNGPIIPRSRWDQLKKMIAKGEGISFFSETIFRSYLENAVDISDLKLSSGQSSENNSPASNAGNNVITSPIGPVVGDSIVNIHQLSGHRAESPLSETEDAFIEQVQQDNIGVIQLRSTLLSQPQATQQTPSHAHPLQAHRHHSIQINNSHELEPPPLSADKLLPNDNTPKHKYDAILNYYLSRV